MFIFQTFPKTKEKLSAAMKACNDILQDLLSKKHAVNNVYFISDDYILSVYNFGTWKQQA